MKDRLNLNESVLDEAKEADGHKFYKITVRDWFVFGKLDEEGGKKHHLPWKHKEEQ